MKYSIIRYLAALLLPAGILSCHKSATPATASLTIINAVVGADTIVTNFSGNNGPFAYGMANQLLYGAYSSLNEFSGYLPKQPLSLYLYPDTTAHSTPLFNLTLDLPASAIQTLFLTGTAAMPDTLLTVDHPPYHPVADSSMGIRFVNLSPGSAPVSVNIEGQPAGSTVGSLPCKGITAFVNFAAGTANDHYTFQFRDAASGVLLAAYTLTGVGSNVYNNLWRNRNITIAFYGLPGVGAGPYSQGVFVINNY